MPPTYGVVFWHSLHQPSVIGTRVNFPRLATRGGAGGWIQLGGTSGQRVVVGRSFFSRVNHSDRVAEVVLRSGFVDGNILTTEGEDRGE